MTRMLAWIRSLFNREPRRVREHLRSMGYPYWPPRSTPEGKQ